MAACLPWAACGRGSLGALDSRSRCPLQAFFLPDLCCMVKALLNLALAIVWAFFIGGSTRLHTSMHEPMMDHCEGCQHQVAGNNIHVAHWSNCSLEE